MKLELKNLEKFKAIGGFTEEVSLALQSAGTEAERTYIQAVAVAQLRSFLTDELMKPIMALQGSPLGFKTDKDKDGGYPVDTVRDCAIVAMMTGVRLHGNELNILGGNPYIAVNGCERLLASLCDAPFEADAEPPIWDETAKKVTVKYAVRYRLKGADWKEKVCSYNFRIQVSQYGKIVTTDDQCIGKSRRKTIWAVLKYVKGIEIHDTDDIIEVETVKPSRASIVSALEEGAK
jgi:hypothetical protein